jgi:Mg-chelatase subunit ChlI
MAMRPRSTGCRAWRYAEKLATPDITIADLIGGVDPIRVAEGRYLSDELTLHYGLIPRANRGIFADQRVAGPRRADRSAC